MNKKIFGAVLLIMVLSLEGCTSPNDMPTESESYVASDSVNGSVFNETVEEVTSSSDNTILNTNSDETYDPSDEQDDKNPGSDVYISKYNGDDYMLDINTVRFIVDDTGNVIEPENNNESPLKYVYHMSDYELIGKGDILGTRPDAKLYLTEDNNILSVFPCEIEAYTDAESILSKYSREMIFEAQTFIRIDD